MNYMGSKGRFTTEMLPIILEGRKSDQWYVEPFAGGMNMISEVTGKRIANDLHTPLIEMWRSLVNGWNPGFYSKEEYLHIKSNQDKFPLHELGWVGFVCSFRGLYFGGFAGESKQWGGIVRDYQIQASKNIMKQVPKMKGVVFENNSCYELVIPPKSIVYCDPPYQNTKRYAARDFNYQEFWDWVRIIDKQGHKVFVSEYSAPDDFKVVWEKVATVSLGTKSKGRCRGKQSSKIERLFTLK